MIVIEIALDSGVIIRQQFSSKLRADNARRKLAKEMEKGKFRNDHAIVEIKGDTGTTSVNASSVASVSVVDDEAWNENNKTARDAFYARHPDEKKD